MDGSSFGSKRGAKGPASTAATTLSQLQRWGKEVRAINKDKPFEWVPDEVARLHGMGHSADGLLRIAYINDLIAAEKKAEKKARIVLTETTHGKLPLPISVRKWALIDGERILTEELNGAQLLMHKLELVMDRDQDIDALEDELAGAKERKQKDLFEFEGLKSFCDDLEARGVDLSTVFVRHA